MTYINKEDMIFFLAFILSITLLGSIIVGPLSIRVYATVAMFIYLLFSNRKNNFIHLNHSYLKLYILFLVLMGLSQLIVGEIIEYQYFKKLLAYHFVCIITFLAIERFVNNRTDVSIVILLLTCVMLLNNITTILQFIGNNIGWSIGQFFGDISENVDFAESHDTILGFSRTPGIFGNVVNNAFAIAVFSPLSLCLLNNNTKGFLKIFALVSYIIAFVACFMTQQRAAFYLILLCFAVYLFSAIKKHSFIFIILCLSAVLSIMGLNLSDIDFGRLSETTNDVRIGLYKHAFAFIAEHPFFGGPMTFQRIAGLSSHNVALDSWIFAGFFGFITMMILILKTVVIAIKTVIRGLTVNGQDRDMIFCSIAVINAMAYGFTHNTSYLTGNVIIFIALALMLKSSKLRIN